MEESKHLIGVKEAHLGRYAFFSREVKDQRGREVERSRGREVERGMDGARKVAH